MKDITKKYTNNELTIVWKPSQCIHSGICFKGLPAVFDPRRRPWIIAENASTKEITAQINKCTSGALSYYMNAEENNNVKIEAETIAEVSTNGPLLVYGSIKIKHSDGREEIKNKVTAFCRCGQSSNKPYCDGTHRKVGFEG